MLAEPFRDELLEHAQTVVDELGTDHTESVYHKAYIRELSEAGISVNTEASMSVLYKGYPVGTVRPDMFVTGESVPSLVAELKRGGKGDIGQLLKYVKTAQESRDYGGVVGGVLIRFEDPVDYEWIDASNI